MEDPQEIVYGDTYKPRKVSNGYNPGRHSALPYVDKQYKTLLDKLAEKNGRNKKRQVEIVIEQVAKDEGVL